MNTKNIRRSFFVVAWLLMESCHAAIIFYRVDVPKYGQDVSGYYALANGLYYAGRPGPAFATLSVDDAIAGFRHHFATSQRAALEGVVGGMVAVWQKSVGDVWRTGAAKGTATWLLGNELRDCLIELQPRPKELRGLGQLAVIDDVASCTISDAMQTALVRSDRVSMLINIGTSQTQPLWVVIGVYQKDGDTHVCTMDSAGDAFVDKSDGSKSDLVLAIEKIFASTTGSPGGAASGPDGKKDAVGGGLGGAVGGLDGGLINQGATCYMNSTVQAMYRCPALRTNILAALNEAPVVDHPDVEKRLVLELRKTLLALGSPATENPAALANNVVERMDFESMSRHQDAADFFTQLTGVLQAQELIPDPTAGDYDRADDGFNALQLQGNLRCSVCGSGRISPPRPDYTCILPLEIPPAGAATKLIAELFAYTSRSVDVETTCETCNDAGDDDAFRAAHPGIKFGREPKGDRCRMTPHTKANAFIIGAERKFFVVQVKRFEFDFHSGVSTKLVSPVIFPAEGIVPITDSAGDEHRFKVAAVVVHSGSLNGGHYWCVTPHGVYNDTTVTLDAGVAMRTVLTTGLHDQPGYVGGTGYLYFLERV